MNLTWHIMRKDLRALRWPVLVWVTVIVAKLGVGWALLAADGTEPVEWFNRMDGIAKVLAALEGISFVLAAAFIQEDLLVGTRAFWRTRPISGGRLLGAKLLSLALVFGVTPLLLTLPWWLHCGYGPSEIAWAALETAAIHALCVLIGVLWAVVTDGFGRFLMWTLVSLFAIPTLIGTLSYYLRPGGVRVAGELQGDRTLVIAGIALVGLAAVVAHQYLTRRTGRSIGIIATAASLIVIVGVWWPWSLHVGGKVNSYLFQRAADNWPTAAAPAELRFVPGQAQLSRQGSAKGGSLRITYGVEGLANSDVLLPAWSAHAWRWFDGSTQTGRTWGAAQRADTLMERTLAATAASATAEKHADTIVAFAGLTPADLEKLEGGPPGFTLHARLRLMRFDSIATIPWRDGARPPAGIPGERVAHVEQEGEELLVTIIRTSPSLWVDNVVGGPMPSGPHCQYLLMNKSRDFANKGETRDRRTTRIATVFIDWRTTAFRASKTAAGSRPTLAAINAVNDADLVRATYSEQARFTRVLQFDQLAIERANR